MKKIILASASPRRRELMHLLGMDFEVVVSEADEHTNQTNPSEYVCELSQKKAEAVREHLKGLGKWAEDYIIIGADTIVSHHGNILTKPEDAEQARQMIRELSGDTHQVYTGVTLFMEDKIVNFFEKTDVSVYNMTDEEIERYILTGEPMDKAGAYGIQGKFAVYIQGIQGDYNNVVGLPVARLYHELKDFL